MIDLTDCDREPIHIPGTIQPYGVLLALAEPALTVAQVSENVGDHLPLGIENILGQPLSSIIDPASVDELREALREARWYEANPLRINAHGRRFDRIVHRARSYFELFSQVMRHPPTVRNHANVLQHMAGYVSEHLDPTDRSELTELTDRYRRSLVPLIVPITLLRHYVRKYEVAYLSDQVYLDPHPDELMLLNHL
jgi:light-regulated signal transduction histidine kinase (bacteriophytochrome)